MLVSVIFLIYFVCAIVIVWGLFPLLNKKVCMPSDKKVWEEDMLKRTGEPLNTTSGSTTYTESQFVGNFIDKLKHSFKIGDRVNCYWAEGKDFWSIQKGIVENIKNDIATVKIDTISDGFFKNGETSYWHVKQCRRIKKKEQSIRITKEEFEKVWDSHMALSGLCKAHQHSQLFADVWNELTKKEKTK